MSDWLRLHRSILESRVFQNEGLLKVWVYCLCRANWKKTFVPIATGRGTTEVELQPGQFVFGRNSAARALRMKPSTVHDRMQKLVDMQNIVIQAVTHYSIVTVCNWGSYQDDSRPEQQPTQQPSVNHPSPKQQPSVTEEESKESKDSYSRPKLRFSEEDMAVAVEIWSLIEAMQPDRKRPKLDAWANTIRLMVEQDGRTHEQIHALYVRVNRHQFWRDKVLSPDKLREKWDDLRLQLESPANRVNGHSHGNGSPAGVHERGISEYL